MERHTLQLPDLTLSYLMWGEDGDPVLLLHGLADSAVVWSRLGPDLADTHQVVAPDLRGHGESGKPLSDYSFPTLIADLQALVAHLGWSGCSVVAHSWSAKLAARWVTASPAQIRKLILVDPFFMGRFPAWSRWTFPLLYRVLPFLKVVGSFKTYEEVEQIARQLKQYREWTPLQQAVFTASVEQQADGSWRSKFPPAALDPIFDAIRLTEGLTHPISTPTLLIRPTQGLNRWSWQLRPYQRYCKHLQIQSVPGNHWALLGQPQVFNQVVKRFLAD